MVFLENSTTQLAHKIPEQFCDILRCTRYQRIETLFAGKTITMLFYTVIVDNVDKVEADPSPVRQSFSLQVNPGEQNFI